MGHSARLDRAPQEPRPAARRRLLPAAALAALLGACAADPAREADRPFTAGMARVEDVELTIVSIRPPRLRVDVRGSLPDACTEIEPIDTRLHGSRVEIELATRRPYGAKCLPAETPFARSIPLMLSDEVRAYLVDVNGVRRTVVLPPESGRAPLDPGHLP